jgi:tetratricopeptide (TPR) repeat protein
MKTNYELVKWHMLALAIGFFPRAGLAAPELSADFSAARILYEERRYSEAREIFRRLAADQPDSVEVNFYLGRLALWFDDEAAALAHLEKAARVAPQEARIQTALGDAFGLAAQRSALWAKLGWAKKCLAAYQRAVELAPHQTAPRWSLLGYYCAAPRIAGGGGEKAVAQAEAIARLDPMGGRIAFATLYLSEHRPVAAFAQFDEVLRENSDDFLALYQIGRCAALSGEQLERGRTALQRCLQLSPPGGDGTPTLASAHHRLGNILEKLGDVAGARKHYAMALSLQPDFRAEKETLKN